MVQIESSARSSRDTVPIAAPVEACGRTKNKSKLQFWVRRRQLKRKQRDVNNQQETADVDMILFITQSINFWMVFNKERT